MRTKECKISIGVRARLKFNCMFIASLSFMNLAFVILLFSHSDRFLALLHRTHYVYLFYLLDINSTILSVILCFKPK